LNVSASRPDTNQPSETAQSAATAPQPAATAPQPAATAAQRVLEAELSGRSDDNDALSMMMSSMVRMVQAGQSNDSRWKAS
jgi:hypothetical protein